MLWQCPNFKPLMNCRFREERASKRTEKRPTGENYHSKQRLHCEWSLYSVPGGCKGITCFTRGAGKGGRCRCDGRATSKQTGSRGLNEGRSRTDLVRRIAVTRGAGGPEFRLGPAVTAAPTRIRVNTPHLPGPDVQTDCTCGAGTGGRRPH